MTASCPHVQQTKTFRSEFFKYKDEGGDWVESQGSDGTGQWKVNLVNRADFHSAVSHLVEKVRSKTPILDRQRQRPR